MKIQITFTHMNSTGNDWQESIISIIAKSVGLNPPSKHISHIIFNRCLIYVQDVIKHCSFFSTLYKNHRLDCKLMNSALQSLKIQPLIGYSSNQGLDYRYAKISGRNSPLVLKDTISTISHISTQRFHPIPQIIHLDFQMLGKKINIPHSEENLIPETDFIQWLYSDDIPIFQTTTSLDVKSLMDIDFPRFLSTCSIIITKQLQNTRVIRRILTLFLASRELDNFPQNFETVISLIKTIILTHGSSNSTIDFASQTLRAVIETVEPYRPGLRECVANDFMHSLNEHISIYGLCTSLQYLGVSIIQLHLLPNIETLMSYLTSTNEKSALIRAVGTAIFFDTYLIAKSDRVPVSLKTGSYYNDLSKNIGSELSQYYFSDQSLLFL